MRIVLLKIKGVMLLSFLILQITMNASAQEEFIVKNKVHWGLSNSYPMILGFPRTSLPLPSSKTKGMLKYNFLPFMIEKLFNQQLEATYINNKNLSFSLSFGPRFYAGMNPYSPYVYGPWGYYLTNQESYVLSSNISKVYCYKKDRVFVAGGGFNYIPYHKNAYTIDRHYSVVLEGKHAFGYHLSASTLRKFRNNEKNLIGLHVRYEHLIPSYDFKEQALRYKPNTLGLHTIQVGLKYMRNTAKKNSEQ